MKTTKNEIRNDTAYPLGIANIKSILYFRFYDYSQRCCKKVVCKN